MGLPDMRLSGEQIARFHEDGFLIVDRLIAPEDAARAATRFEGLFEGEFETGLIPDDFNWGEGVNASRLMPRDGPAALLGMRRRVIATQNNLGVAYRRQRKTRQLM